MIWFCDHCHKADNNIYKFYLTWTQTGKKETRNLCTACTASLNDYMEASNVST